MNKKIIKNIIKDIVERVDNVPLDDLIGMILISFIPALFLLIGASCGDLLILKIICIPLLVIYVLILTVILGALMINLGVFLKGFIREKWEDLGIWYVDLKERSK